MLQKFDVSWILLKLYALVKEIAVAFATAISLLCERGDRTREGIGVSECVRWTCEQPMVEASLNEARERLQPAAKSSVAAGVIPSWCTITQPGEPAVLCRRLRDNHLVVIKVGRINLPAFLLL